MGQLQWSGIVENDKVLAVEDLIDRYNGHVKKLLKSTSLCNNMLLHLVNCWFTIKKRTQQCPLTISTVVVPL